MTQVIKTNMVSERKIRDYLTIKYDYSEIEQELLLMHMKNTKMIEICQITIKNETTEEEQDYRAVFSVEKVDDNEDKNLKILELELNLYELSDAITQIEKISELIPQRLRTYVQADNEILIGKMLRYIIYAEEVWVNIAKCITMVEEQLQAFKEISEVTIKLLIRQSRRDIFFYEK